MSNPDRLRDHPKERLALPAQVIDLVAAAARLRAESHGPIAGHRQIAVARQGPVTVILFAFEPDGLLKEHRADGEVLIQVLRGRLQVTADHEDRTIGPGTIVALAPGLPHSVRALEATDMLLTVHRQPPAR
jgi:quercetin dioxygenase-like cupin family protein